MSRLTDQEIEEIARRIAADIGRAAVPVAAAPPVASEPAVAAPEWEQAAGIFATVSEAVRAAGIAQPQFVALPLAQRSRILEAMRQSMRENCDALARAAHDETGYGRYEDKIVKNRLVTDRTPGIEDLAPIATSGRSRPDPDRAGAIRRHRRDHAGHEPDLHDHLQLHRHAGRGQQRRLQRAPVREELLHADDRPAQQGDHECGRAA